MTAVKWAPFAKKRPMPYASRLPARTPSKTMICHTNGGGTDKGSLFGWFARAGNDICSHFQVMNDGTIEQYLPIDREAYAEFTGNAFGVSVETEDDGNNKHPWTEAQIASLVKIARWLDCPARVAPDSAGGGIGWHSLYTDWNQSHHDCPGSVRVAQIHAQIIPALKAAAKHPHPQIPSTALTDPASVEKVTTKLTNRKHPVVAGKGDRNRLRALIAAAKRALGIKAK